MSWVLIGEIDGPVSMQSGVLQFRQDRRTPRNGGDTCDPRRFRGSWAHKTFILITTSTCNVDDWKLGTYNLHLNYNEHMQCRLEATKYM